MDTRLGSVTFVPPYPDSYDRVEVMPNGDKVVYLDGKQYVPGDPVTTDILLEHMLNARKRLDILETLLKESR